MKDNTSPLAHQALEQAMFTNRRIYPRRTVLIEWLITRRQLQVGRCFQRIRAINTRIQQGQSENVSEDAAELDSAMEEAEAKSLTLGKSTLDMFLPQLLPR